MATPNYGYEKRQKELAKKRKKEEKLKARAERKVGPGGDVQDDVSTQASAATAGADGGRADAPSHESSGT